MQAISPQSVTPKPLKKKDCDTCDGLCLLSALRARVRAYTETPVTSVTSVTLNHRLSDKHRGRYTESPGQRSRQNRLVSHAEIKSPCLNLRGSDHATRWSASECWTSERFEDTRRHGAEQEAVALSAGSHAERGDRHGASHPCRNRSRALRAPEGVKINSCDQKSGWTIGFAGPRAQVSEVPPGAACEETPGCDLDPVWARNNPQSHIDVLKCSICKIGMPGRGGKTCAGRHGPRWGPTHKLNRNIASIGCNIGMGAGREEIAAVQSGPRWGHTLLALTQDFHSSLTRARARGIGGRMGNPAAAPWTPLGNVAHHKARQKKFGAQKSFFRAKLASDESHRGPVAGPEIP